MLNRISNSADLAQTPALLRQSALQLWADGHRDWALSHLSSAAADVPDDADLWREMAGLLYIAKRHREARDAVVRALEIDPNEPRCWLLLATLADDLGDIAASEAAYLAAFRFDAACAEAAFGLGALYFRERRFDESKRKLQTAAALGVETLALYVCLGQTSLFLGDFAAARSAFARAAAFPATDASLIEKLAQLRLIEALGCGGCVEDAIEIYRQTAGTHARDPAEVTKMAFQFLSGFGYREAAIRLGYARLSWAPEDPTQRYHLAALEAAALTRAPTDYLIAHFNGFAENFDRKLLEGLQYRVPEKLHALISAQRRRFSTILDLGCGTGLAGIQLRPLGERLVGIDLSPRMLEKAGERGIYDRLVEADIEDFLAATETEDFEAYDLVVAADVLIYLGDLVEIFVRLATRMLPTGVFAFSIEKTETADFAILPSGRFAHSTGYIERLAEPDFHVLRLQPTVIRLEANQPVAGTLVILQRR